MIDKIRCEKRFANDSHKELIAMWEELQKGWVPPTHISEEEYNKVKNNKHNYPDYYVGYVGYHATFGAKYFGGYARGSENPPRDRSNEAYKNTMKQLPLLSDVIFLNSNYLDLQIKNSVIYCDPPYQNTIKYEQKDFNHEQFWEWCRDMNCNNFVFISEYCAPKDFVCIWSKESIVNFDSKRGKDTNKKLRTERLFVYGGGKN